MTGEQSVIAARLAGWKLANVDVLVGMQEPAFQAVWRGDDRRMRGALLVTEEEGPRADFRCLHGASAVVYAPSYQAGIGTFLRVVEFEPSRVFLAVSDAVVVWTADEGVSEWAM